MKLTKELKDAGLSYDRPNWATASALRQAEKDLRKKESDKVWVKNPPKGGTK